MHKKHINQMINQSTPARRWANVPGVTYPPEKRPFAAIDGVSYPEPCHEAEKPALKPLAPVPVALPDKNSLLKWRKRNGAPQRLCPITQNLERRVRPLLRQGWTWPQIAKEVEMNPSTLRKNWVAKFGPTGLNPGQKKGAR